MRAVNQNTKPRAGALLRPVCLVAGLFSFSLGCSEIPLVSQGERETNVHPTRQLGSAGGIGCGDGVWEPDLGEECDTGEETEACSADCTVTTMLASQGALGTGSAWRQFGGAGRPVAANAFGAAVGFVQADPAEVLDAELGTRQTLPPQLGASLFDVEGARLGEVLLPGNFIATQLAAPSIAAVAQGKYVTASSVLGEDADESGIALHLITVEEDSSISVSNPVLANQVEAFAQSDPTILWSGAELVVAWVDHSDGLTGPDVRYRRFDENLDPLSTESTLADGLEVEGHVTLARLGDDWAAAYRVGIEPGVEVVRVTAPMLGLEWETESYVSPSSHDRPALVNLDDGALLVAYVEQTQATGDDIPLTGRLRVAVPTLSNTVEQSGPLAPCVPPFPADIFFDADVSQGSPALARAATQVTLAWQTEGIAGNPLGQELWQWAITWPSAISDCTELDYAQAPPAPLPGNVGEAEPARLADQRRPAIFASGGTAISAWEEFGSSLSSDAMPDIAVRVAPVEITCSVTAPCELGEGHCETDEQCAGALTCGYQNGEAFGKRPSLNACIACGNGVTEIGEECDEGAQTATCNANCTLPFCGDGVVGTGEACDPGLEGLDTAECNANCTPATCGDGYVNPAASEDCEPLVAGANDADCDSDCTAPACGDGIVNTEAGEVCELSNPNCSADCTELSLPCGGGGCPIVRSYRIGSASDGDIRVVMQIDHSSGTAAVDLSHLELRYWLYNTSSTPWELATYSGHSYVVESDLEIVLIPPVPSADKYVRVPLEGTLNAGQVSPNLDFSFHHTNWEGIYEPDDHSYVSNTSFVINPDITLYYDGVLVWGNEPAGYSGGYVCGNSSVEGSEECDTGGESATCDADCTDVECGDGTVNTSAGEVCDPGDNPDCYADCSGIQCTDPNTCLHLLYANYSDDSTTDQQIKVSVVVVNNGPSAVDLDDVTIRYWFVHEPAGGGGQTCECDWFGGTGGCSVVVPNQGIADVSPAVTGANKRWDFGFQNADTLAPGQSSGAVSVHFQNNWWNALDDTNDYSYASVGSSPYVVTTTITAYLNGTLVWGQEPE